jgi:serine/threonine protein kinase
MAASGPSSHQRTNSTGTSLPTTVWPSRISDYQFLERLPRRTNPSIGRLYYGSHASVYRAQLTPTALAEVKKAVASTPSLTNGTPPLWNGQFALKVIYSPLPGVTLSAAEHAVAVDRQLSSRLPSHPSIIGIQHSFTDHLPSHPAPPDWDTGIPSSMSLFTIAELSPLSLADVIAYRVRNGTVLSIREALLIARDISNALVHMQNYLVAHRDMKPDHILIRVPSSITREQAIMDLTLPGIVIALADFGNSTFIPSLFSWFPF